MAYPPISAADDTDLSPTRKVRDWRAIEPTLLGASEAVWKDIVINFYFERLKARYLEPIQELIDIQRWRGEGYSIVALQCSLLEFLQSCVEGVNYKPRGQLGPYEYRNSKEMFTRFLIQQPPFAGVFNAGLAEDFYYDVRCGILHEARAKGRWLVHGGNDSSPIVTPNGPIIYRNRFQLALLEFINNYVGKVPSDGALQEAFIRKFNHLCNG